MLSYSLFASTYTQTKEIYNLPDLIDTVGGPCEGKGINDSTRQSNVIPFFPDMDYLHRNGDTVTEFGVRYGT